MYIPTSYKMFSASNSNAKYSASNVSKSTSPIILDVNVWNASATKCMQPKLNKSGGKQISVISSQTNRMLSIVTPSMMTWGIADFTDDRGVSDGKFSMSLNFPLDKDANDATNTFLDKMKAFEEHIKDVATENSPSWWGTKMSRDILNYSFFPSLKYPKNKETKQIDFTRPPSMRVKVPCYDSKWAVEIYDTKSNLLFPCENEEMMPMDFVPKQSQVVSVIQCSGIWIGGKGWGLTWKLVQCVVKPFEVVSIYGKCHIQVDGNENEKEETIPALSVPNQSQYVNPNVVEVATIPAVVSTYLEDSDNEEDDLPKPVLLSRTSSYHEEAEAEVEQQVEPEPEPDVAVVEPEPEVDVAAVKPEVETKIKKVIKKTETESLAAPAPTVVKKKIIKKSSA